MDLALSVPDFHLSDCVTGRRTSLQRTKFDPLDCANEHFEVESLNEFLTSFHGSLKNVSSLDGFVFSEVDFSSLDAADFLALPFSGASFYACNFPASVSESFLREHGAFVLQRLTPQPLPFKPLRALLYSAAELAAVDPAICKFYAEHGKTVAAQLSFAVHDFSILDAIQDYAEGKPIVSVMGGHGLSRCNPSYDFVTNLARSLAKQGFIIATGGGPGAMEAANCGAYLADKDDQCVQKALQILKTSSGHNGPEFEDTVPALNVLAEFGAPQCWHPSIGVPTWLYYHEPTNLFCAFFAKFFQNAIREEILLKISYGGLVFTPGSAGTLQEVFQAACLAHYAKPAFSFPLVFFGKEFWTANGVFEVVRKQSSGKDYGKMLLLSDELEEIVNHLMSCARENGLVLLDDFKEQLKNPYWYSKKKKMNC